MSNQEKPGSDPVLTGKFSPEDHNDFQGLRLGGLKLQATCPHCGYRATNKLADHELIDMGFNTPIDFYMFCDGPRDQGCGDNFTVKIKLNFSVELA